MNQILHFLESGLNFLFSLPALDHIIFLVVFALVFQFRDWKNLLLLFGALAVGFSLSLFLGSFKVVSFTYSTTRILLAASIFLMALIGLFHSSNANASVVRYNLMVVLGLLQGLGFTLRFRAISKGCSSLFFPTLGFDLGLILGCLGIILLTLAISSLLLVAFRSERRDFNLVFSGIGLGIAIVLLWIRL